ncbi:MAG TPA: hypothetical protein VIK78_19945 [Ruminiclostridium sp.]
MEKDGTKLYNGIMLPEIWPPKYKEELLEKPLPVPYLENPPDEIIINVGRQLLVDDFLIQQTDLKRVFHNADIVGDGPVFEPKTDLEMNDGYCPVACPFNDGVFYDEKDHLFKMWYHAGWFDGTAYAESEDGIHWRRLSELEAGREDRIIPLEPGVMRDGAGAWIDHDAKDPSERYKMFVYYRRHDEKMKYFHESNGIHPYSEGGILYKSANGVDWQLVSTTGICGDNTTFFYNPFRKKWVFSIRTSLNLVDGWERTRGYYECDDFFSEAGWKQEEVRSWGRTDIFDEPDPVLGYPPQLYNLDAVGYESLMLGAYSVFLGPPNDVCEKTHRPKIIDMKLAFSRDGFHWHRPDYNPFIPSSRVEAQWDYGYIHPNSGICLVVGDKLYFYFSAWSGISPKFGMHMYAGGSMGLATLRRDGFASMEDQGKGGYLVTRKLRFNGKYLFVNADAAGGKLEAEMLDENNNILAPFSRENCVPVIKDGVTQMITWNGAENLSNLTDRPVRIKFYLQNSKFYSFWISPSRTGASLGYVAGGGPNFKGGIDNEV